MELNQSLLNINQMPLLWQSTVGIERESLRIKHDGQLADTPHSSEWGTRSHQPYIQTDFAESQLELITPPDSEADVLMRWLAAMHQITATTNEANNEWMSPTSSPNLIPENTDSIKIAQLENPVEYNYRAYLAEAYGKHVQLLSGIHFNLQINPVTIETAFQQQDKMTDFIEFNNHVYLHMSRNYFRYRWFLTYILGSTPFIAENYATNMFGKPHRDRMRSVRQSRYGYQNDKSVRMNYDSLEAFVETLEDAVTRKALSLEKELYRDVRFRGGSQARDLLTEGITYLEFRNVDLNPLLPYGIDEETINFIRLFVLSLLYIEDVTSDEEVDRGHLMNDTIAEADALDECLYPDEAYDIVSIMKQLAQHIPDSETILDKLNKVEGMIADPSLTLSGQLVTAAPTREEFFAYQLKLAEQHQATYLEEPYLLHGFEYLELSTQDVVKEAIKIGIKVEVIDAEENLLRLQYKDKVEYVKNANMTRLDSLISYYLMENKVATKQLLAEGGLNVPGGTSFTTLQHALAYYPQLKDIAFVVKPKNTNYGLGISIFKQKPSYEDYQEALEIAFGEDETVLIEAFIAGTELRFYVQNGETVAIVERQPAQVTGDGESTIDQLIDQVNEHPLRGKKHLTPLTEIEKGRVEAMQLKNQGLTFDSVPAEGEIVYLRENSNVSTGGFSFDRTETAHPGYKEIAEKSAQLLEANFCGVDIIITDYTQAPDADNYGIIEANFNPSILIHRFPWDGTPRLLGKGVLEQLFPEAFKQ